MKLSVFTGGRSSTPTKQHTNPPASVLDFERQVQRQNAITSLELVEERMQTLRTVASIDGKFTRPEVYNTLEKLTIEATKYRQVLRDLL